MRFEFFTAVTMKNAVFWNVMPCGSCKNRRFGGTYHLNHQGNKNRRATRRYVPPKRRFYKRQYSFAACFGCLLLLTLLLAHRFLPPWWCMRDVPPKGRLLRGPHGIPSQKTAFFMIKNRFVYYKSVANFHIAFKVLSYRSLTLLVPNVQSILPWNLVSNGD
jgi:hypothetical protein